MRFHHRKRACECVEQRIVYRVHRSMLQSQPGTGPSNATVRLSSFVV